MTEDFTPRIAHNTSHQLARTPDATCGRLSVIKAAKTVVSLPAAPANVSESLMSRVRQLLRMIICPNAPQVFGVGMIISLIPVESEPLRS